MRVITEPAVYLVGKQTIQDTELSRFLADHGVSWESDSDVPAEILTETAGRVCYMSFQKPRPGGNSAYLTHIKEVGHGSVLEHAVWNLLITGVSRTLTHELVRHRAGFGFSQLSQRYVDESVAEYVEPDIIANDPELHALWLESVTQSHAAYVKLAEKLNTKLTDPAAGAAALVPPNADRTTRRKIARQAARSVLPNATETKIFVTANSRALRHFLEQRGSAFAEPEIRKLAGAIHDILVKDAPNLFGDYEKVPLPDGTFELTTQFKKVERREVNDEVRRKVLEVYARADAAVAEAGPRCDASGRCCRFTEYEHTLFISQFEAEILLESAPPFTQPVSPDGCAFQIDGLCTARGSRPLGCRIYFCDPTYSQRMTEITEDAIARLKAIADEHDTGWHYAPLHHFLNEARPHLPMPDSMNSPGSRISLPIV